MPRLLSIGACVLMVASSAAMAVDGILCHARRVVGSLALPQEGPGSEHEYDIRVVDGVAYIAGGQNRFFIVDVSDPSEPVLLEHALASPRAHYLDVEDGIAYLGGNGSLVRVFDVSDPAAPVELGSIGSDGVVSAMDATDGLLYFGRRVNGLAIVDVSNPSLPVAVGEVSGDYRIEVLQVVGTLVYAVDQSGRLDIFDVGDPSAPFLVSRTVIGSSPRGLDVVDGVAYVIAGNSKVLKAFDVSDPTAPFEIGQSTGQRCEDVRVVAGRAYLASPVLAVVDASDATELTRIGETELIRSSGAAIEVVGDLAYVFDRRFGLEILDVGGSIESAVLGRAAAPGVEIRRIDVGDGFAVAIAYGIEVYDLTDPTKPGSVARNTEYWLSLNDVRIDGRIVYAAADEGLLVYDISDLASPPVLIATLSTPSAQTLDVAGGLVVLAAGSAGIRVIDVSDPASPVAVGVYFANSDFSDVRLAGNFAFVADRDVGLRVFDLSDPSQPVLVTTLPLTDARAVDVDGSIAGVVTEEGTLHLFDVSDPRATTLLSALDTGQLLSNLHIDGGLAFIGYGSNGNRQVIDISDPLAPRLAGWFESGVVTPVRRGNLVIHATSRVTVSSLSDCVPCSADFNGDGVLDMMDVQYFLNLFAAGDDRADFAEDGVLDFFDLQAFLNLYAAGCP